MGFSPAPSEENIGFKDIGIAVNFITTAALTFNQFPDLCHCPNMCPAMESKHHVQKGEKTPSGNNTHQNIPLTTEKRRNLFNIEKYRYMITSLIFHPPTHPHGP